MRCPVCDFENAGDNNFCVSCGEPLPRAEASDSEITRVDLNRIEDQIRDLRNQVATLRQSLNAHGIPVPEVGRSQRPAPQPTPVAPGASPNQPPVATQPQRMERPSPPPTPQPLLSKINWEPIIGGNWLARVGALAIIIGVGFFLGLAFENNWINETGRVILGLAAGAAFIGAGEFWRKKYPVYAQALSGTGVALLYISIFAAYSLYSLIGIYTGTGVLLSVSVLAAALALRHDAVWLAVIGIVGSFFAPFLLGGFAESGSTDSDPSVATAFWLLAYILIVDIGVIALSTFRSWSWFIGLALVGSLVTFGLWDQEYFQASEILIDEYGRDSALLIAEAGITGIFLSFVAATTLFHLIWRRPPQRIGLGVMFVNAIAYAWISYGIMWNDFRDWMGLFTLMPALLYAGVSYMALKRFGIAPLDLNKPSRDVLLTLISIALALIFVTIAIPVQIGGPWVPVAWTVEALALMWISFRQRMPELRYSSLIVFGLAAIWLTFVESPAAIEASVTPFWNEYLPVYVIVIAGMSAAAYLLRRNASSLKKEEKEIFAIFVGAAVFLLGLGTPVQLNGPWLALAWAVEGLAITWLAIRLGIYEMRLIAIGLFVISALRALLADSEVGGDGYTVLWNTRLVAFGPLIVSLSAAAYLWGRIVRSADVKKAVEARFVIIGFVIAANFLALWMLSAEVIGAVNADAIVDVADPDETDVISLGLTVLWGLYGGLALSAGFIGGWRTVRMGGLILLAVPVFKLFLFDSFQLESGLRVAAFLLLGVILLTGGYLYQRHAETFNELFLPQKEEK